MFDIVSNVREFLALQHAGAADQLILAPIFQDWDPETVELVARELNEADTSDPAIERKVMYVLSEIISRYETSNRPSAAIAFVLSSACCQLIRNQRQLSDALESLLTLCSTGTVDDKTGILVIKTVMFELPVRKLTQPQRHSIFGITQTLLQNNTGAMVSSADELIPQFIQAMDGERDPRNLLIAFKIFKNMTRILDVSKYIEDLFELLWCYFPITFKPPPNDPYAITSEELKQHLRECIAATPYFAKFAMPSLQEKLEHPSDVVKKEAIATITVCAPVYGAHALLPGISDILGVLSTQIFYAKDSSMQELALNAIHVITKTLATGISITAISDPIQRSLDPLIDECIVAMKQPEHKNARSAISLLRSAASASDPACTSIVQRAVPALLSSYKNAYNDSERIAILELIIEIMDASRSLYGSMDGLKVDRDFMTPLLSFKEPLLDLYSSAAQSSMDLLQYKGCHGLYIMAASRHFLADNQVADVVKILTQICCNRQISMLRTNSLASIRKIGLFCPSIVTSVAIPYLFSKLRLEDQKRYILGLLSQLSSVPAIYEVVVPTLSEEFVRACIDDHDYAEFVMENIVHATEEGLEKKNEMEEQECWAAVIKETMLATVRCCNSGTPLFARTLHLLAYWLANIVRRLSPNVQYILAQFAFTIYANEANSNPGPTPDPHVNVLDTSAPNDIASLSILFAAMTCNCRKEVMNQHITSMHIPLQWIHNGLDATSDVQLTTLSQLAAVYANQWIVVTKDANVLQSFLDEAVTKCILPILHGLDSLHKRRNALTLLTWLTKALIITGKPVLSVEHIVNALQNEDIGRNAASGFQIIVGDNPILLNKQSFANVSILYKQRLYNNVIQTLLANINDSPSDIVQENHLIALCHILGNVPKQVYIANLTSLFPFLVRALRIPDTSVKLTAIQLVMLTIDQLSLVAKQHIQSIIPSLLELSRAQTGNTIPVRIAALACLGRVTGGFQAQVLIPYANTVIKELANVLDDRKRLVRRAAVDCRALWYAVGQKG